MKKILSAVLSFLLLTACSTVFNGPICGEDDNLSNGHTEKIKAIRLQGVIHFANGSAELSQKDKKFLDEIATVIAAEKAKVVVYGHASHYTVTKDPIQRILINMEVSNNRAVNVSNYLISKGVPLKDIYNFALYDSRPVALEKDVEGQAQNRRVEIYLYWPE